MPWKRFSLWLALITSGPRAWRAAWRSSRTTTIILDPVEAAKAAQEDERLDRLRNPGRYRLRPPSSQAKNETDKIASAHSG